MEMPNYFSNFNVLYMTVGSVAGVILYMWLSIARSSRIKRTTDLKTYISSDDLIYDLTSMDREIPCAIVRGFVRQRNLKILDHSYEGVLRQTQTEEVYEKNILPQTGNEEEQISFFDFYSRIKRYFGFKIYTKREQQERITTVDELESVDFGLVELMGNKWLVEELGPPEEYAPLMKKTSSDVSYFNCNNVIGGTYMNPIIRSRTLMKVTNVVSMLLIGAPVTIVGKITVSDFGNIQFSRPSPEYNYLISSKSPEALSREESDRELYIMGGIFLCAVIGLYGALRSLQELIM